MLRLRRVLPFALLNKSASVKADNLSEVDSIREALVHTLIVSACIQGTDPVTVSTDDVRRFLGTLNFDRGTDLFPTEVEDAVLDLIQELAEYGEPADAALLTREIVQLAEKFMGMVAAEWDTVNSSSAFTFSKRWARLVILWTSWTSSVGYSILKGRSTRTIFKCSPGSCPTVRKTRP